jgi:L-lactate dehydrogenase complex protein LldG
VSEAREAVLGRVRTALAGTPPPPEVPSRYRLTGDLASDAVLQRFVTRVEDYRATVMLTDQPATAISSALVGGEVLRIGVPANLPAELRPGGAELVTDTELTPAELDGLDGALTTCAAACADTGTIALAGGPGEGRRALTLVPDLHVCVVRAEQIVETVPELFARLEPAARDGRPIVLVSGPSATSDIELVRVEGVHGPRRLVVVVDTRGIGVAAGRG